MFDIKRIIAVLTPGLFRFILAFLVVVFHTLSFFPLGHYAVYVFFILSGYWIFKMYYEKYSHYKNSYSVYLQSRFFRLLPLYWIILIITFFVHIVINGISSIPANNLAATILSNIFLLGASNSFLFVVPAWSLDIEVQFYIIAPLLLYLSRYINSALLVLVSILVSLFLLKNFLPFDNISNNLFYYLPFFLIGGWIYLENIFINEKISLGCVGLILILLTVNYALPGLRNNYFLNLTSTVLSFNYSELVNVTFAVLTIPFITNNVKQKSVSKNDGLLSSMSYVIYLLHWPLLLIYGRLVNGLSTVNKIVPLLIFYIVSIFLSYLISNMLDAYFERRRKYWFKKKKLENVQNAFS